MATLGAAPKYVVAAKGKLEFDEKFTNALDQVISEALHEVTDGALCRGVVMEAEESPAAHKGGRHQRGPVDAFGAPFLSFAEEAGLPEL